MGPLPVGTSENEQASGKSVQVNASWMAVGTATYAGSQLLIAVALARLDGPSAVGLFALASALAVPVLNLTQLSLRQLFVADFVGHFEFLDHVRLRYIGVLAATATVALAAITLGFRGEALVVILAVTVGRASESVADIYFAPLQKGDRLDKVARLLMLRAALTVGAVVAALVVTSSVAAAAAAFAVACLVTTAVVAGSSRWKHLGSPETTSQWDRNRLLLLAKQGTPLAIVQLLVSINGYAPRYALAGSAGVQALGQYAALEYFVAIGTILVNSLGQAGASPLARFHARGLHREFYRLTLSIAVMGALVGVLGSVVAVVWGHDLVGLLYGAGFSSAAGAFPYVMAASVFSYAATAAGYAMTAKSMNTLQIPLFVGVVATNGLLCVLLVPAFGIYGAAAASAAASVFQCAAATLILAHRSRTAETRTVGL